MLKVADKAPGSPRDEQVSRSLVTSLIENVERSIKGKRAVVELACAALLAKGHVLFEDVPGVGKTTLSLALSRSVGLEFSRVQCTADLLPSDIIGAVIYDSKNARFDFRPGPVFANIVLVDEINRATPKTQSALLEAMGEATVSVDRQVHALPQPFWVIATQNPLDVQGTHSLPENQLDRFLMRLSLGYPDALSERAIVLSGGPPERPENLTQVVTHEALSAAMEAVKRVHVDTSVADYAIALCRRTRESSQFLLGASTRAAVALMTASRSLAWMRGREFVIPDDVIDAWVPVMNHRVVLRHLTQQVDRQAIDVVLQEMLQKEPLPT